MVEPYAGGFGGMMHLNTEEIPEDLSPQAVKAARRLQNLPNGKMYGIILVKGNDEWTLCIEAQGEAERIRE